MSKRDFLSITDISIGELRTILDLAVRPPSSLGRPLDGLGAALIFEKPSNRTRQSMEIAVTQLGGHPVYTRGEEIQFDVREPVEDVARTLAGYHGVICARVFRHAVVERLAAASSVPVVNMLSDTSHPMQALADVLTMEQVHGSLAGAVIAWVGDFNNVARSLGEVSVMLGAHIRYASPAGYGPSDAELARLGALGPGTAASVSAPLDAVSGAIAVHTDTWTSMGQESEKAARLEAFRGYSVTSDLMSHADPSAGFYHCMPAYRGVEVDAAVMDGPMSRAIQQGHNRLHSSRALLAFLMGVRA
jgi:ornithine carbamoyltransferase